MKNLIHLDRKTMKSPLWIFSLLALFLFCAPKINLIRFHHETAGIRIDDLLILGFWIILGSTLSRIPRKLSSFEFSFILITLFSLLSLVINFFLVQSDQLHLKASPFYALRLVEYFIFFYIGVYLSRSFNVAPYLSLYLLLNMVLMFLQKSEWIGNFRGVGYEMDSSRVSGLASFPAEMGLLLNLLFCFFLFHRMTIISTNLNVPPIILRCFVQYRPLLLFLLIAPLIALTGARIALITLMISLIHYTKCYHHHSYHRWLLILTSTFIMILSAIFAQDAIIERSEYLFRSQNLDLIGEMWQQTDPLHSSFDDMEFMEGEYDLSWLIRLNKWLFGLRLLLSHPECYLQGLGPGVCSAALDGGLLRIFLEYGVIGSLLFIHFFKAATRISPVVKLMTIALLIHCLFFDGYLAYKPMALLFLMAGYTSRPSKLPLQPIV